MKLKRKKYLIKRLQKKSKYKKQNRFSQNLNMNKKLLKSKLNRFNKYNKKRNNKLKSYNQNKSKNLCK